jgi:hypothetical protein
MYSQSMEPMTEEEFRRRLVALGMKYESCIQGMNAESSPGLKNQWRTRAHGVIDEISALEKEYAARKSTQGTFSTEHPAEAQLRRARWTAAKHEQLPTLTWLEYHDELLETDTELLTTIYTKLMAPEIAAYEKRVAKRDAIFYPLARGVAEAVKALGGMVVVFGILIGIAWVLFSLGYMALTFLQLL